MTLKFKEMSIADNVARIITIKSRLPAVHSSLLGKKSQQTSEYFVKNLIENEDELKTCKCFGRMKERKLKLI